MRIRRALLSVSNKDGLLEFASDLKSQGVQLVSTGGTAKLLSDAGLEVTEVSEHTGFPEMMAGRVKTLHPKIHGGILGRRGVDESVMEDHGIDPIDLVVVNLYPFAATVAREDCTLQQAIENIDIGGPAMVRSAAKNFAAVAVVTDPADYASIMEELKSSGGVSDNKRYQLALKAFSHTAAYDGMISNYLGSRVSDQADDNTASNPLPAVLNLQFRKTQDMRYGENPHQIAAFYQPDEVDTADIVGAVSLQGKALSYNNIADAGAALECVKQFERPACVVVKHANPCGVAVAAEPIEAYQKAYQCDPTSAFGGIIAFNRKLDEQCVQTILDQQFVEVLLAPDYSAAAVEVLKSKPAIRALQVALPDSPQSITKPTTQPSLRYQSAGGGLLVQSNDDLLIGDAGLSVVSDKQPTEAQMQDLIFAWKVAKFVKSNAIVYANELQTIGVGAGQMSRVYSARIAAIKAQDESLSVAGSVMASDAFFPFRDGIDSAAEAGIVAVIQPGGSKNDQQVVEAANEHGMSMVFTGVRHFRH